MSLSYSRCQNCKKRCKADVGTARGQFCSISCANAWERSHPEGKRKK